MKKICLVLCLFAFCSCENPVHKDKIRKVDSVMKDTVAINILHEDSISNKGEFEVEILKFVDSIDFISDTLPPALANYAYKDLQNAQYEHRGNLYVYSLDYNTHLSYVFLIKDSLLISKIDKIEAFYFRKNSVDRRNTGDFVLEIWSMENENFDKIKIGEIFRMTHSPFPSNYYINDNKIYVIHTRAKTLSIIVDLLHNRMLSFDN